MTLVPRQDVERTLRVVHTDAPEVPAWLQKYAARGFSLLFWYRTSDPKDDGKGPHISDWPQRTYHLSDFRDGQQVGVKLGTEIAPGKFLWDADYDWAPGIQYASRLMAPTGFVYGRPGKPRSHECRTTSAPVTSYKYQDVDGTVLSERRGTKTDGSIGLQSMLPPSTHYDSGEGVTLASDGDITHDDTSPARFTLYNVALLLGPRRSRSRWRPNGSCTSSSSTLTDSRFPRNSSGI